MFTFKLIVILILFQVLTHFKFNTFFKLLSFRNFVILFKQLFQCYIIFSYTATFKFSDKPYMT